MRYSTGQTARDRGDSKGGIGHRRYFSVVHESELRIELGRRHSRLVTTLYISVHCDYSVVCTVDITQ